MMFLRWLDINILEGDSIDEYDKLRKEYYCYLDSIRPNITQSVYNYAIADWHYDANIHYSPHDANLKEINIFDNGEDSVDLKITLIGSYQDYILDFSYQNVISYSIDCIPELENKYDKAMSIHGTFLWDSIEYDSKNKLTKHYIVFSSNIKIVISCKNFDFTFREEKQ